MTSQQKAQRVYKFLNDHRDDLEWTLLNWHRPAGEKPPAGGDTYYGDVQYGIYRNYPDVLTATLRILVPTEQVQVYRVERQERDGLDLLGYLKSLYDKKEASDPQEIALDYAISNLKELDLSIPEIQKKIFTNDRTKKKTVREALALRYKS